MSTVNQFPHSFSQMSTCIGYPNLEHEFPQHWHAQLNLFTGEDWDTLWIRNINAPMVASTLGATPDPTAALLAPRPIAPNQNIFQSQNTGHRDMNLIRVFSLSRNSKEDARTLAFNARSANLLNHTNVTAVNTVLSSSAVGQPIAAETARRIELGVRFSF